MIIVLAKVSVKPEKKNELLELAKGVIAETLKEEGCISYVLLDNTYDPGGCLFAEEWASKEALMKHAAAAHILEWRKMSKDLLSSKTVIKIYQGEQITL